MSATILNIKERNKSIAEVCRLSDFTVTEGDKISPETILDNPAIFLYCLDDTSRCAIFVELPAYIDLSEVPFYHQTLFENAKHLIAVPYEAFNQLAANSPVRPENVIVIQTTGRAGSTLLHKIFNQINSAVSLSEPDAFAAFVYFRPADGSRDDELVQLLRSCLVLTFKPIAHDGATTFAFKLRHQAMGIVDLLDRAFPDSRNIFLYRNAVDFASSFYRIFLKVERVADQSRDELTKMFYNHLRREPDEIAPYLHKTHDSYTVMESLALLWLLLMDYAYEFGQQGVPLLGVRYEDLEAKRPETLRSLFEYCNLPAHLVPIGLRAFERDAQEGTPLARENPSEGNTLVLTPEQEAQVRAILAKHPVIRTPDYILPGTLQV